MQKCLQCKDRGLKFSLKCSRANDQLCSLPCPLPHPLSHPPPKPISDTEKSCSSGYGSIYLFIISVPRLRTLWADWRLILSESVPVSKPCSILTSCTTHSDRARDRQRRKLYNPFSLPSASLWQNQPFFTCLGECVWHWTGCVVL